MKIGIDIRTACNPKTGKGRYTYHLVKELLRIDQKNQYILYTNQITADTAHLLTHLQPTTYNLQPRIKLIHKHPFLWHFAVIKDFAREGGNVFFAPTSFIIPAFLPRSVKSVITIHDLVAFLHPHLHHKKSTIIEHLFFRRALKKTSRVLAPSENTKRDLMKIFHYPEEKITVTPLGICHPGLDPGSIDPSFREDDTKKIKEKYKLPEWFILTVAGLEPRKNVEMLVDVILDSRLRGNDIPLVIVGGKGWQSKKLQEKIAQHRDRIIHIENCSPEDLPAFYHAAKIFVFPSLYEGFGLPPLEAMASGCPVICSNAASLTEVCGDAALLFDPHDKKGLEAALEKMLKDEGLRQEFIQKGLNQAKKFSWQNTAKLTYGVFQKF